MKLKILTAKDEKTLETAYNEFEKNYIVNFTQSHVTSFRLNPSFDGVFYSLFVLYEEKKSNGEAKAEPKISDKQKLCPNCNKAIPKTWENHAACGWNIKK